MKHLIKKLLAVLVAALLILVLTSGSDIETDMADLVRARTDIMNGYFCGHINYSDALEKIKEIEKGRLLEEDIQAMRDFFQTDIEEVNEYEIREVLLTNQDEEVVSGFVTVDWKVSGIDGKENFEQIYSVIMEKDEKNYKLIQFF